MGKNNILGIELKDKGMKEKIYGEYVKAFEEGVYDEVVEVYDPSSQEIVVNHYFSGGLDYSSLDSISSEEVDKGVLNGLLKGVLNGLLKRILYEVPVEVKGVDPVIKSVDNKKPNKENKFRPLVVWSSVRGMITNVFRLSRRVIVMGMIFCLFSSVVFGKEVVNLHSLYDKKILHFAEFTIPVYGGRVYILGEVHSEYADRLVYDIFRVAENNNFILASEGIAYSAYSYLYGIDLKHRTARMALMVFNSFFYDRESRHAIILFADVLMDNMNILTSPRDITSFSNEEKEFYTSIINSSKKESIKKLIYSKDSNDYKYMKSIIRKILLQEINAMPDYEKNRGWSEVKELVEGTVVNKKFPYELYDKVIVDVRDVDMSKSIIEIINDNPGKDVVVFIGKRHVYGITEILRNHFYVKFPSYTELSVSNFKDLFFKHLKRKKELMSFPDTTPLGLSYILNLERIDAGLKSVYDLLKMSDDSTVEFNLRIIEEIFARLRKYEEYEENEKLYSIILDIRKYLYSRERSEDSLTQINDLEKILQSALRLSPYNTDNKPKDTEIISNTKGDPSALNKNGGIDFNPNNMTISETGDKSFVRSVVKDLIPNNTYNVIRRVTAVISNMTPITNLPQLLGL